MLRMLAWEGTDRWRVELAEVELRSDGLLARGVQVGDDPQLYRLDYRLDALDGFRTRRLEVELRSADAKRSLDLRRDASVWSWRRTVDGRREAPSSTTDAKPLSEAEDCDLAFSPLTNLMPIRRAGLSSGAGALDLVCAWVSVPDLSVRPYPQRYEYVRRESGGSTVRFVDRGPAKGFVADLALDPDDLVIDYPGLARRVAA